MNLNIYLIVDRDGSVAVRKRPLYPNTRQVVIPLRLLIPDETFQPRLPPPIVIDVPQQHIIQAATVETFASDLQEPIDD